jgi:toxic protein SymE
MFPPKDRKLKVYSSYKAGRQVPELRLRGLWLENLGFHIGDCIRITTREKLLIIEPVKKD